MDEDSRRNHLGNHQRNHQENGIKFESPTEDSRREDPDRILDSPTEECANQENGPENDLENDLTLDSPTESNQRSDSPSDDQPCYYQRDEYGSMNRLCDDLLILIFKHLTVDELFTVEQVCKRWYHLAPLNRRNCLCVSQLSAPLNEHRSHFCPDNRLHNCNPRQRYVFGDFRQLQHKVLPSYQSVQSLHLNLQNMRSAQQKLVLGDVALNFNNLVHLQIQSSPDSSTVYRQLAKLRFLSTNRLQHLLLCHTVNYEAGDLVDLSLELACTQRAKSDKERQHASQYAHYKIPCKFPCLRTFHSDFASLQLPPAEQLVASEANSLPFLTTSLPFLRRLRLDRCVLAEKEFACLHRLFPNLEHLALRQLDARQCLALSSLFANTIQTLRVNEIEPHEFCAVLGGLCSMRKLRYVKLVCSRLSFDCLVRTAIIHLQRNCPLLTKFVLNKLHLQTNALEDYVGYWRTFDTINRILKRSADIKYIDLNKLELCWPHIDLKHFLTALRYIRTLYFVTDNAVFADFQCLLDRSSKLRTLHFDYQNTENSKAILLNLVQHSPKLRVLKLNQVELAHNFMAELPRYCPNLVLFELNPKRFMHHPCKYNFNKLAELGQLSQLCLSNMKIHDKELASVVAACAHLAKLHVTSSRGLSGCTVYQFKQKAATNPDVHYELSVDGLNDTKYFNFYLLSNFLTSIDNHSFSKINFEPFQKLIVFTPSDEPTVLNVTEWNDAVLRFKDFKRLTRYFSKMRYYYIKKTENNKEAKWTELANEDDTPIPSHNSKILLEFYESENFIF